MSDDYSLSDKIGRIIVLEDIDILVLHKGFVKDFVRKLKEEILSWNMAGGFKGFIKTSHVADIIDKLAGEELI